MRFSFGIAVTLFVAICLFGATPAHAVIDDWGVDECMGPDDVFCGGGGIAKFDYDECIRKANLLTSALSKCKATCTCQYKKDNETCKLLSGTTAIQACYDSTMRNLTSCNTQCAIDYN
jgi:hypothetical protein